MAKAVVKKKKPVKMVAKKAVKKAPAPKKKVATKAQKRQTSPSEKSKKQAGRRMCEDCGDVTAAFGYETARKRRWCKKCASGHGLGVVNLSKSVNPNRLVGPSGAPATAANLPPGPKVGGSHSLGP